MGVAVADLGWLHDGEVRSVAWLVETGLRTFVITLQVPPDDYSPRFGGDGGPFAALAGRWVAVKFHDCSHVDLVGHGALAGGDNFDGARLMPVGEWPEPLRHGMPPGGWANMLVVGLCFTSGSEMTAACASVAVEVLPD